MSIRQIDRNGWFLIFLCVLGVAVSVIPIGLISLSVFMKPLAQAFGWGRGQVAMAITLLALAMAAGMPIAGRLIDRFGARRPLAASLLLFSLGLAGMPFMIVTFGIAGFYATAAFVGVASAPSSSVAYVKILSGWFDSHRGLALGFAMSGIALGAATAPLMAATLIAHFGWQAGFWALAAMPIVIGLPVAFLLREAPGARSAAVERAAGNSVRIIPAGLTLSEALRGTTFALLTVCFLLVAASVHGVQIHLAPLLSDRGLSPQASAAGLSYLFIVSALARLVCGYLFDRIFAPWVGALCFGSCGVGMLMLMSQLTTPAMISAVALVGIGAGAESDLLALLVSRYYGMRAFGAIYGSLFAAFLVGSALGPLLLGVGFDRSGNYVPALGGCAVALALVTALLFMLPRFPTTAAVLIAAEHPSRG